MPWTTAQAVARRINILDGLLELVTDHSANTGRIDWSLMPSGLKEKGKLSFGERIGLLAACQFPGVDVGRIEHGNAERMIRFRNDEAHGRVGRWLQEEMNEIDLTVRLLMQRVSALVPVRGRCAGRSIHGGSVVELEWSLSPHLLFVRGLELADDAVLEFYKPVLLEELGRAKGGGSVHGRALDFRVVAASLQEHE